MNEQVAGVGVAKLLNAYFGRGLWMDNVSKKVCARRGRAVSPRVSKSRHLDKYPYFLNYDDPSDIPFDRLAEQLGVHPNLLRGMIRSARSNGTIFAALRKMGYGARARNGQAQRQTIRNNYSLC